MAQGDANVNFDLDRLTREAEKEKRQLAKLDQIADENAKKRADIVRKDPSGLAATAIRQQQRAAAAAAALPNFPGVFQHPQMIRPPSPTIPLPPFPQFGGFSQSGSGFNRRRYRGNDILAGGVADQIEVPGLGPSPSQERAANQKFQREFAGPGGAGDRQEGALTGLSSAVRSTISVFKGFESSFQASIGPFSAALGAATAAATFFASSLQLQRQAAGEASRFFGSANQAAGWAAAANGGNASKYVDMVNASSNREGAFAVLGEVGSRGVGSGRPRISDSVTQAALQAIDQGAPRELVLDALRNNNLVRLNALRRQAQRQDNYAKAEIGIRREEAVAEANAENAAAPEQAEIGRLRAAQLRRFRLQNPTYSNLFPDTLLISSAQGISGPGFRPGTPGVNEAGLSLQELRIDAHNAQVQAYGLPNTAQPAERTNPGVSPVSGGPDVSHSGQAAAFGRAAGEAMKSVLKSGGRPSPSAGLHQ